LAPGDFRPDPTGFRARGGGFRPAEAISGRARAPVPLPAAPAISRAEIGMFRPDFVAGRA